VIQKTVFIRKYSAESYEDLFLEVNQKNGFHEKIFAQKVVQKIIRHILRNLGKNLSNPQEIVCYIYAFRSAVQMVFTSALIMAPFILVVVVALFMGPVFIYHIYSLISCIRR